MKRTTTLLFALLLPAMAAMAQKLPKTQTASVLAPADIKIDGKATEWGDKFQAFNRTTEVYYTLSNSDTKLYLTIQANERNIIRKIIGNGITLTVAPANDAKKKLVVTYPHYAVNEGAVSFNLRNPYEPEKDTVKNNILADSVMNEYNAIINDRFKVIGVIGVESAEDSTLSLFNTEGFKAMGRLNRNLVYTYELAIPLSYIVTSADKPATIKYNIMVNGVPGDVTSVRSGRRGSRLVYKTADGANHTIGGASPDNMSFAYPSDFSAEYTLAK